MRQEPDHQASSPATKVKLLVLVGALGIGGYLLSVALRPAATHLAYGDWMPRVDTAAGTGVFFLLVK